MNKSAPASAARYAYAGINQERAAILDIGGCVEPSNTLATTREFQIVSACDELVA